MTKDKSCTMSDMLDAFIERSYKMKCMVCMNDSHIHDDIDEYILDMLADHVAFDNSKARMAGINGRKLSILSEQAHMCLDHCSTFAYIAKCDGNVYEALALSYLEWIKYFSGLTPSIVERIIYNNEDEQKYTVADEKQCNLNSLPYNYIMEHKPSNKLIHNYIIAKLEGVEIRAEEVSIIKNKLHNFSSIIEMIGG